MKSKKPASAAPKRYPDEFKHEALALANQVGVTKAAKELGLYQSQLYAWRNKAKQDAQSSERENAQAAEIARLKRKLATAEEENAILKKASAYFAKHLK